MSELEMGDFSKSFESFLKKYLEKRFDQFVKSSGFYSVMRGVYIVPPRDVEFGYANIYTVAPKIIGHVVQIYRRDEIVTGNARVNTNVTMLEIRSGETYQLTEGDRIHWIVW